MKRKTIYGVFVYDPTGKYRPGQKGHVTTFGFEKMAKRVADRMNKDRDVIFPDIGYPERGYVVRSIEEKQ